MSTARDLISGSLRLLGALASSESLDAQEATDGLSALNAMIESWSTERLAVYSITDETFSLVSSQSTYTMGSGGDFNTTRPMRIDRASLRVTGSLDLPVKIITAEEYAAVTQKSLQSSYPEFLYVKGTYPLETLVLWPVPSAVNSLVLFSWKPLSSIASLDTTLSFPPGYERALRFNLAVELAPEYGRQSPPEVMGVAMESKAAIKRQNQKTRLLRSDAALIKPSQFNIMTGEPWQ